MLLLAISVNDQTDRRADKQLLSSSYAAAPSQLRDNSVRLESHRELWCLL